MIQAAELRIGNLIWWEAQTFGAKTTLPPTVVEVASVSANEIGYFSPTVEHRAEPFEDDVLQTDTPLKPLEDFSPIPLTAEILQNLQVKTFPVTDGFEVYVESDGLYLCQDGHRKRIERIVYVHQLQNLYVDFTGDELEIRLWKVGGKKIIQFVKAVL